VNYKYCRHVLVLVLIAASPAIAQYNLPASDPRSPQYQEYQRQENERKANQEASDRKHAEETAAQSAASYQTFMENQHRLQEKLSGQVEEDRAMFLKMPPLPAERNGLIGQWKLDTTKTKPTNALAELNAMISEPMCEMVFGTSTWDFRAKSLWGDEPSVGIPMQQMTEVEYRGNEGIVGVVPKTFMRLLVFKIVGRDRVQELTSTRIGADPCTFKRVGTSTKATVAPASKAPTAQVAATAAASVTASPSPAPRSTRPSPEICAQTLLDQLGKVGVNQVRAMSDVRFKEPAIDGVEPNTGNLRIDLRGSACDDPRLKATLYDFDREGMLQSITYVWDRPAGPAPAPIFQERVKALTFFHKLPPPQSAGRLQADTSLGRLIIEDLPSRNLLLEAYKAKK